MAVRGVLISIEEMQLLRPLARRERDRILAGEARVAKALAPFLERIEAVPTQVAERIRGDVLADLLDRMTRGEQLLARRRVDAVKARVGGRRRRDTHVDLGSG